MRSERVALVADDNGMVRLGLALTLKDRLGFDEVVEAGSLDDALAVLGERTDIGLALFDLSMPGMAGAASLRAACETYPELRVAVMSGREDRGVVLEAFQYADSDTVAVGDRCGDVEQSRPGALRQCL